jgi:hypothetical protein
VSVCLSGPRTSLRPTVSCSGGAGIRAAGGAQRSSRRNSRPKGRGRGTIRGHRRGLQRADCGALPERHRREGDVLQERSPRACWDSDALGGFDAEARVRASQSVGKTANKDGQQSDNMNASQRGLTSSPPSSLNLCGYRENWNTLGHVGTRCTQSSLSRNDGVRGSSPRVGSQKGPGNRTFLIPTMSRLCHSGQRRGQLDGGPGPSSQGAASRRGASLMYPEAASTETRAGRRGFLMFQNLGPRPSLPSRSSARAPTRRRRSEVSRSLPQPRAPHYGDVAAGRAQIGRFDPARRAQKPEDSAAEAVLGDMAVFVDQDAPDSSELGPGAAEDGVPS